MLVWELLEVLLLMLVDVRRSHASRGHDVLRRVGPHRLLLVRTAAIGLLGDGPAERRSEGRVLRRHELRGIADAKVRRHARRRRRRLILLLLLRLIVACSGG
jgi:hypothetical protein